MRNLGWKLDWSLKDWSPEAPDRSAGMAQPWRKNKAARLPRFESEPLQACAAIYDRDNLYLLFRSLLGV
jgi:hypothetical protein